MRMTSIIPPREGVPYAWSQFVITSYLFRMLHYVEFSKILLRLHELQWL
jgi:hypothetical protein